MFGRQTTARRRRSRPNRLVNAVSPSRRDGGGAAKRLFLFLVHETRKKTSHLSRFFFRVMGNDMAEIAPFQQTPMKISPDPVVPFSFIASDRGKIAFTVALSRVLQLRRGSGESPTPVKGGIHPRGVAVHVAASARRHPNSTLSSARFIPAGTKARSTSSRDRRRRSIAPFLARVERRRGRSEVL